jgi:hypothetical protein
MILKAHWGCLAAKSQYQLLLSSMESSQTSGMPSQFEIESFIGSSFRSIWSLDLVHFLNAEPGRSYSHEELIAALRASESVISQSIASLAAAGLILVDRDRITLHIADDRSKELIESAIRLYVKSPDKVRRLIISAASPGLTAFADAFRLRKD